MEHNHEDPQAGVFKKNIEENYKDVLFERFYAHQIDPAIRGEYGQATITLKGGAMPKKKCAFRLKVEREEGFKALMAKFKKKWVHSGIKLGMGSSGFCSAETRSSWGVSDGS